jgi:hypothetical protein
MVGAPRGDMVEEGEERREMKRIEGVHRCGRSIRCEGKNFLEARGSNRSARSMSEGTTTSRAERVMKLGKMGIELGGVV